MRQFAVQYLAFDLKSDNEEEHRHQRIVDPGVKGIEFADRRAENALMEQVVVSVGER